ncbi:hypothetical protein CEW46_30445 [Bacillus cereus]|nr:hypothetical protein CEW46_30445 [Bacillus cereus]
MYLSAERLMLLISLGFTKSQDGTVSEVNGRKTRVEIWSQSTKWNDYNIRIRFTEGLAEHYQVIYSNREAVGKYTALNLVSALKKEGLIAYTAHSKYSKVDPPSFLDTIKSLFSI